MKIIFHKINEFLQKLNYLKKFGKYTYSILSEYFTSTVPYRTLSFFLIRDEN